MSSLEVENLGQSGGERAYIPGITEVVGDIPLANPEAEAVGTREVKLNDDGSQKSNDDSSSVVSQAQQVFDDQQFAQPHDPLAAQQSVSGSLAASDSDQIEDAWIALVKEVIRQTAGDPFEKQREVNRLQAEYLKKRHNISIEVDA